MCETDATILLNHLRGQTKVDGIFTNPFGETVWLKASYHPHTGERFGVTDCCFVEEPCKQHSTFPIKT